MTQTSQLLEQLDSGVYDQAFALLYPRENPAECRKRYGDAVQAFAAQYGARDVIIVSAPGRTEIGGNHTDHQHGCVLAAAVDLDIICVAAPNHEQVIRVRSEGYEPNEVSLENLSPQGARDANALIRGVAEWLRLHGYQVGGFDAYTTSRVLGGSGLSSSAAFEVAVGQVISLLFCEGAVPAEHLAMAGKYAENHHFGKPSGLMDQMASAVGGFVGIDFADPDKPRVDPVSFSLEHSGYQLCIVDTKGSHANLTPHYAAIPEEMRTVADLFGKSVLGEVPEADFWGSLPSIRTDTGDRALLRALHFFAENRRARQMKDALEEGNIPLFLELIRASGKSSWELLQNVIVPDDPFHQELAVALAVSEVLLWEDGGWRVHGGGFAGTIQAFVPDATREKYVSAMCDLFGADACHQLSVRPVGASAVTPRMKKEDQHGGIAL